ncbi:MAG: hypothetical protein ACXAC2_10510 [Candidatus Kariarchaeaceae archaeon]
MKIKKIYSLLIVVSLFIGLFSGIRLSNSLLVDPNDYTLAVSVNDELTLQFTNIRIMNPDGTYSHEIQQQLLKDAVLVSVTLRIGDETRFTIIDINTTHIEMAQEFILQNGSIYQTLSNMYQPLNEIEITNMVMTSNFTLIEGFMSQTTITSWDYDANFIEFRNISDQFGFFSEIKSKYDRQTGWLINSSQRGYNASHTLLEIEAVVDTRAPSLNLINPKNETYNLNTISLDVSTDERLTWIGYSLNGQANVTISGNTTLIIPDGSHSVIVFANDSKGNMGASETVWFTVDTQAPIISLISPSNVTYAQDSIWVNFSVSETPSWIAYSLDGAPNVTIAGNTFLGPLTDGSHFITIYTNDSAHNTGYSTEWFSIDTVAPDIIIFHPQNTTYTDQPPWRDDIWVNYTINEPTSWIGYSFDGAPNVTVTDYFMLGDVPDGSHSIVVFANDTLGNMGKSMTIWFTVDMKPPVITISTPLNSTYTTNILWVDFSADEPISWIGYSLDGGAIIPVSGNFSIGPLSEGSHVITVFINDSAQNMVSSSVWFTIDTLAPEITISSPTDTTYSTQDIWVNFTINEATSWIGYSLDGTLNITVVDEFLLDDLAEGSHSIIIYASDSVGNIGASITVLFTIELISQTTTTSTTVTTTLITTTTTTTTTTSQLSPGGTLIEFLIVLGCILGWQRYKKRGKIRLNRK